MSAIQVRRATGRRHSRTDRRGTSIGVIGAVLSIALLGTACGADDAPLPLVGQIAPAVEALDAALDAAPGEVEFFEVNADVQLVNLFVASDAGASVTGYIYVDGELIGPAPSRPVEAGYTFGADDVDFDPSVVLARVSEELPGSEIVRFVITATDAGGVRYEAFVRSAQGGALVVVVDAEGEVLAVLPV